MGSHPVNEGSTRYYDSGAIIVSEDRCAALAARTTGTCQPGRVGRPGRDSDRICRRSRRWLAAGFHLKPKTRASYGSLLRNQVLPRWGSVPVGRIRTDDIAEWINGMIRAGLSPSRTRQAVYVVSLVCDHAIRAGRLGRDPVRGVKLPRLVAGAERQFLAHDQVQQLAAVARPYGTFIRTLAYAGLRWGEITALRVRDVDLNRRWLGEIAEQMWPERGQCDDHSDDDPPPVASARR